MKTLLLASATVALLTAVNLAPAMAQGQRLSSGNTCAGISQPVETSSANAATTTAHYEYRYGYDKHGAWRDHWVLVRKQTGYPKYFNEPAAPDSGGFTLNQE